MPNFGLPFVPFVFFVDTLFLPRMIATILPGSIYPG
jgi:uncharacterized protein YceK